MEINGLKASTNSNKNTLHSPRLNIGMYAECHCTSFHPFFLQDGILTHMSAYGNSLEWIYKLGIIITLITYYVEVFIKLLIALDDFTLDYNHSFRYTVKKRGVGFSTWRRQISHTKILKKKKELSWMNYWMR